MGVILSTPAMGSCPVSTRHGLVMLSPQAKHLVLWTRCATRQLPVAAVLSGASRGRCQVLATRSIGMLRPQAKHLVVWPRLIT